MIIRLAEATQESAGAKAAVLGRLIRAGFPVPPGFVIPVDAYRAVTAHLDLAHALSSQDPDEARHLVESQPVPPWLLDELAAALADLGDHPVAVRSSATTEDTPNTSAAGQHDSFLGIHGLPAVTDKVQTIWGSLWSQRATTYRQTQSAIHSNIHPAANPGIAPHASSTNPGIAVIVQRHLDAEVAGVLFTADSRTVGGASVIEASWGLGESVVQGLVTPDTYTLTSPAPHSLTRRLGTKLTRRDRNLTVQGNGRPSALETDSPTTAAVEVVASEVPRVQREQFCLSDGQVHRVMQLGQDVAEQLGGPQDLEFALENDRVWLLQSRPITAPLESADLSQSAVTSEPAVLRGVGGSPGTASGPVRLVERVEDFGRVERGDILVCRFTDPAWTPLFGLVAGVVTEVGGSLSHAAIVAREHRIPAVLGVPGVMSALENGQQITIVGNTGQVHRKETR
ncbi:PEP/pyruvate-binding domain-containing protein [Kribbella catacumbae]|uniref:PEP/pyruvate-binding domain-containing protein n=1 Tax=Kribbella catacumbae TaxID=460086 RepID=UPI00037BF12E|nr:PEP/pyruvate-binding domain-containing protein [Kribbella catacumbae]